MRCFVPNEDLGTTGDLFGSINALFSGLTVAGLIYTLIQQQDANNTSIKLFHEEKHQTKTLHDEQKEQARNLHDEQKDQAAVQFQYEKAQLKIQLRRQSFERFENSFYGLIAIHHQTINLIDYKVFPSYAINRFKSQLSSVSFPDLQKEYNSNFKEELERIFVQYFNTFEAIVNFVMTRKKRVFNQEKYLRLYFSMLSTSEKILLLYYFNFGKKDPKYYDVYKNWLFEGLSSKYLPSPDHGGALNPKVT